MRIAAFIALLSFFAACGGDELTNPTGPGQELRSDKARITEPSAVDVPELVAGNTRFALNMYHQLATRDGNIFFSPFSISVALAMTYAGARRNTQAQMADALEFTLAEDQATLSMPRFRIKGQTIPLKDQLSALGMPDAFVFGLADFSGMDGTRQLLIGNVLHQAFVEVDEYGTEAAAATAVVMDLGSAQLKHLEVDRPFVFLIRDIQTGAILFLGRVIDPT